jgi:lipopolysaccharide biosynthesis protein
MRRPFAGFNPLAYACQCSKFDPEGSEDPLAHYLRMGRPEGRWSHSVFLAGKDASQGRRRVPDTVAIHGHFHYPDLLPDFLERLASNQLRCDLFLTTTAVEKAKELERWVRRYKQGLVTIDVVPNRGRDIGPFFTHLRAKLASYDVVGHIHGKRSSALADATIGESWRDFLWEHLIGSKFPMADIIVDRFANDPSLGLVFPEDFNLLGWGKNRAEGDRLVVAMGLRQVLPVHFDFPVGTMFWSRPRALKPLFDLALSWDSYPEEPVAYDGTVLHAIERLLPIVARETGHHYATTHVPGSTR